MNDLMPALAYKWVLTILTGGLAGAWLVFDSINLIRTRNLDRADPVVRDKYFGYLIGITIGIVGLVGCLRFHDVL